MVGGTTPETPNPAPVDALDALFYQHDLVYQHYSDGVITDPALLAAADVQLVKSMYALTYTDPGGSNYDPWAGLYEGFATLGMVGKLAANGTLQHLSLSDQLIIASATNEAVVNLGAGLAQGPAIVAAETVYFEMNSVAPLGAQVPNLAHFANHQYNYGQQIGVIDPFQPERDLGTISVGQSGVATSGRDFRQWRQNGVFRHHIIDPRTGMPADTDLVSVTVIAQDVMAAEMAAKIVMLKGSQAGLDWLENETDYQAIMVLADARILTTEQIATTQWRQNDNNEIAN
jgi:hypothetical protein